MATSAALNWALNNGMTQAEYDKRIFDAVVAAQQSGTSNVALRAEMDRLGITPEDVARATGVTTQSVQEKYVAAVPTTQADLIAKAAADAELAARTARDTTATPATIAAANTAAQQSAQGLLATDVDAAAAALAARQKAAADSFVPTTPVVRPPVVTAPVVRPPVVTPPVVKPPAVTPPVTAPALTTPMPTGATSIAGTLPFANATQGFDQNFRNYTSIPIGAQYNPSMMGGQQQSPTGQSAGLTWALNNGMTQAQYDKNIFDSYAKNSNLTDAQLRSEMDRYGISPADVARATGVPVTGVQSRYDSSNVAGGSPYSQIMAQMRPLGNPYANFVAGTAMGGYNPGLYDQILAANAAKAAADAAAAANKTVEVAGTGDPSGDAAAAAAAAATAADAAAAADASATGGAPGSDGSPGSGAAMGGLITNVFGPDPAGPDEGQVNMMRGEYVIRKSSVNKYGRGLLDMINEGKVPAKKIRSLLD